MLFIKLWCSLSFNIRVILWWLKVGNGGPHFLIHLYKKQNGFRLKKFTTTKAESIGLFFFDAQNMSIRWTQEGTIWCQIINKTLKLGQVYFSICNFRQIYITTRAERLQHYTKSDGQHNVIITTIHELKDIKHWSDPNHLPTLSIKHGKDNLSKKF